MSSATSNTVLADKDANQPVATQEPNGNVKPDVKSLEYHRQVLQSKMAAGEKSQTYISPSDEIMSPCTAKLNAFRNKQVGKVKPKSLFHQASTKRINGGGLFGAKDLSTHSPPKPVVTE